MKKLAVILIFLVVSMAITPAFAVIQTFGTEKIIYKKGDKIVFTGTTDTAHANKIVSVKVYGPDKSYVMLREVYADSDGIFKTSPFDTSIDKNAAKFTAKGVYNATAFYSNELNYIGKFTLFDYSADGSPVVPSAVDLMKEKTIPTTTITTTTTQPPMQPPKTETTKTEEPKTATPPEEKAAEKPKTTIPGFPDPTKDPQTYVDRYNNEPAFKDWFTKYFPGKTIYEVVGIQEPKPPIGVCGEGTVLENGVCVIEKKSGGGCLVATAAYGTELAPQVQHLRELRDGTLLKTDSGSAFMDGFNIFYYSFSPTIADWERQSPLFKETIKATLSPLLSSLLLLNYMHIDSEQELIVYGAGIILLNVGMYFVLPAFVIVKIRKHIR